ncbi:hypothetical protein [Sphingomonas lenta]|uniref:Uncharacterized protein n=1 Tax=Sphingomonas lenta TaxID=1141887 RepID=A0A2A2SDN7_9SPHN|nr:hypothetical protein [Sphingomonas lenta]PAX07310.1 hypothetical protein CKY28_14930 [Sphingomonas lenta]
MKILAFTAPLLVLAAAPAFAETPREMLTHASFQDRDKAAALRRVVQAHGLATAALARNPNDREAALMQATALGYRAKLTGSRGDAVAARRAMERLVSAHPRDPERHLLLGAWHMGAVHRLGRIMGRAVLGASKPVGLSALDRAVALGGDRALFSGLAALLRLQQDPKDAGARALAEAAARGSAPTGLDRHLQAAARAVLVPLRAGDAAAIKRVAARHLPLGWVEER